MTPMYPPWIRYRDTGLCVLPSKHHDLEFAAMAIRAMRAGFQRVCVELPSSLPVPLVTRAVRQLGRYPGGLLITDGRPRRLAIRESESSDESVERHVHFSQLLPIGPDSMFSAMREGGRHGPPVFFIDAPQPHHRHDILPPGDVLPFIDSREVAERGLEAWLARWEPVLRACGRTPANEEREQYMACMLARLALASGRTTLFICGAAHWPWIRDRLDRADTLPPTPPLPEVPRRWPNGSEVAAIDPGVLFAWHELEIPRLVDGYERRTVRGDGGFDRADEERRLLAEVYEAGHGRLSPRGMLNVLELAHRHRTTQGRWSLDLDEHLLPAVRAVGGRALAEVAERVALDSDAATESRRHLARVLPLPDGAYLVFTQRRIHLIRREIDADPDASASRRPLRHSNRIRFSESEKSRLGFGSLITMKAPSEERLHWYMCNRARELAHHADCPSRHYRSRRFRGNLGAGLDYRRTVRSWAGGVPTLFVKKVVRREIDVTECLTCPVVWIFDAQVRGTRLVHDYFQLDDGRGKLFTTFFWFSHRTLFRRVTRSQIAYFVRLYRNVTPSWDRALVARQLTDLVPPEKFCCTSPTYDTSLPDGLEGPDIAVASAVRYALGDHVVVVNGDRRYRMAPAVVDFARQSGIRLLPAAAHAFDPILFDRYQRDHEVPSGGHWREPDPLWSRFVEPVPGFDRAEAVASSDRPSQHKEAAS